MYMKNSISQPSFSGSFSQRTIKMAYDALGEEGAKAAKKFRAGRNKYEKISVIYDRKPAQTLYHGQVIHTDTYMEVSNPRSKKPPIRVILAEGKLPFGQEMLDVISKKMEFLDNLRKPKVK